MSALTAQTISVRPITLAAPGRGDDLLVHVTAPTAGNDLPVVVFSHGYGAFGASMDTYRPLVDHWTAHGFVVVQPNHLDAQGIATDDPRNADLWKIRIGDLRRVIDQLETVLAAIPGLAERTDADRLAVAGHSYGATTASALVGARVIDADGALSTSAKDQRVKAAVLLALTGTGGEDLSPFAQENFPFMSPNFSDLTTPSLIVAGGADDSPLSLRGPDWFTDGFHLAPGATDLLTLTDAEHSLGGINAYDDTHTTDENPDRVDLVRRATTAYLRGALGIEQESWRNVRDEETELGRFESK
ncbi:MAG TPA: chlorophyllase [Nocardioides sp.]|uniref:alpha/beta hydrolase family protein n=1 Tax=uncultured Nocardioides sp. TaxID=198441 RepID=UPI000EF0C557|nr:chlorophyllase [uncultured Nocardioides sp.]HCB07231.1 chlorophyllase [Nocardioides sp.]HRD62879.1 chlorophyllase [Nocardioides sp.]HRI96386.1 chlorophyllase [Nocardioides sp.]HRK46541.1 chlorophyllase [Nocardioides sp.]